MDKNKIDLIVACINGDKNSLKKLIAQEQPNIYSMIFYLNKDINDINDIIQDILIKLVKNIKKLKNPLSYKSWLNQIIINSYYDYLRKNKNIKYYENINTDSDTGNPLENIADKGLMPHEYILQYEIDKIIKNSISSLPHHYKLPLALREIQGLSYEEISNIIKINIGTVKSRISRAREIIKSDIEKYNKS